MKNHIMSFLMAGAAVLFACNAFAGAAPQQYVLTIDNKNEMLDVEYVKVEAKPTATPSDATTYYLEADADLEVAVPAPGGYVFISDKMQEGWSLCDDNHIAQYFGKMPAADLTVVIPTLVAEVIPPTPDEEKVSEGKVCRIGPESVDGHYFDSLADAFAFCGDSWATITLITDFNVSASIVVPADVKAKLDLNGHTITMPMKVPMINYGDLIIDGGSMGGGIDGDNLVNIGRLWILSGTYFTVGGETGSKTYFSGGTIDHYANSSGTGAEFVIAGGDIGLEQGCLPIQVTAGGTLKIIGGTFATDPSTYVETGCEAVFDGKGLYTVSRTDAYVCEFTEGAKVEGMKYETLEAAITALSGGSGKLKLLRSIDLSETIQVDIPLCIDLNGFDVSYFDEYDGNPVFEVLAGGFLEITNSAVAIGTVAGITGVKCDADAILTISGGSYFSFSYSDSDGTVMSSGLTTITGGEFSGIHPIIASAGLMDIHDSRCMEVDCSVVCDSAAVKISGGSYFGECFVRDEMPGSITIFGGYFAEDYSESGLLASERTVETAPNGYVAQGLLYKVVDGSEPPEPPTPPTPPAGYADDGEAAKDGKVCRIGPEASGEYFDSLSAALACCGDSGMTITMICNYEGEVMVDSDVKATLDLNGKTLTPADKETNSLRNLGILVLEDRVGDGQVAGNGILSSGNLWVRGGTVNGISCDIGRAHISGGLITGPVSTISGGAEMVISGGDIRSTLSAFSAETIKITGGSFYSNPESYLVSGYSAAYDGKIQYFVSPTDGYVCEIVGGSRYTTLSAAFNAAGGSAVTIRLLKNIMFDTSAFVGQKTMPTLDLNGFNLDCTADYTYAIVVTDDASLTITNSTVAVGAVRGVSGAVHCEGGDLIINGGEFYGQKALYATTGNVTVHGGRFEGNSAFCFEDIAMTIDGGLFRGSISDQSKSANVSITGGYFSDDPRSYVADGYVVASPKLAYRASGYIAKVSPEFIYYIGAQYNGWKAVLTDDDELTGILCMVQETPADELFAMLSCYDIGTYAEAWAFIDTMLQSKDGYNFDLEVGGDGCLRIPCDYPIDGFVLFNGDAVIESDKEVAVYDLGDDEKPSAIDGNTYPLDPKAGELAPDGDYTGVNCLKSDSAEPPEPPTPPAGYADDGEAAKDGKVCRIGPEASGEYFESLSAALSCCGDSGMTITLICDFEGEVMVDSDIKATIDLNGKTLTPAGKETSSLRNLGTLVLEDRFGGGQVVAEGIVNSGNLWIRSGAVNGLVCEGGRAHSSDAAINGSVTATGTGVELIISGGYINATLSELNGGEISVTGGRFTSNPESYLATGYAVNADEKGSIYDVYPENNYACEVVGGSKYATLSEAIAASGGSAVTIRLLRNVAVDEFVAIEDKMMPTLDLNGFNIECHDDHSYVIDVQYGGDLTITNSTVAVGAIRGYGAIHCSEGGNLVINGGEFYGQRVLLAQNGSIAIHEGRFEGDEAFCFAAAAMTIDGGLFKGTINNESKSPNVTITGGYFSSDPSSYVGDGYLATAPELAYRASGYTAKVTEAFNYVVGDRFAGWKVMLTGDKSTAQLIAKIQDATKEDVEEGFGSYSNAWAMVEGMRLEDTTLDCSYVVDANGILTIPREFDLWLFCLFNGDVVIESDKEVAIFDLDETELPSAIDGHYYPVDQMSVWLPDCDYTGVNCLKSDKVDPPEPPTPPTSFSYTVRYNYEPKGNEAYEVTINTTHTVKDITDFDDAENPGSVFIGWATDSKIELPEYFAGDKIFNLAEAGGEIQFWARYRSANDVIPSGSRVVSDKDEYGAASQVTIVVPDEAEFTAKGITDKKRDEYFGLFQKTVTGSEKDDFTVTIELNSDGVTAVQNSLEQAVGQITDEKNKEKFKSIRANHDRKVKVDITGCVPGIYYSVESSASLEKPDWSESTSERVLCDVDGNLSIVLPYDGDPESDDSQFYRFRAHLIKGE